MHVPGARHKDAAAIETVTPSTPASPMTSEPGRRIIPKTASSSPTPSTNQEVLVIASRLKDFIHAQSEFNTSSGVMDVLSHHLRILCDRAIDNARADGRKTVMDRDFEFLKNLK